MVRRSVSDIRIGREVLVKGYSNGGLTMTCNDCVHSEVCKYRSRLDLCDNYPSENCEDYKDKTSFLNTHFSDDAILYIIQLCIESQSGSDKVIPFIIPYLDKLNMRYLLKIKEVIENHRRYGRWF